MKDIEKRARELLAKAYRETNYPPMVHESHSLMHDRLDRRERAALEAIIAALTAPEGYVLVPVKPTPGLLMSMAMRADHALGCPGYYDQQMFKIDDHVSHHRMLEVALAEARKQHEEVVGAGFYSPEKEGGYAAMLAGRPEVSGG